MGSLANMETQEQKKAKTISASEIAKIICMKDGIMLPQGTPEAIIEGKKIEEGIQKLAWKMSKGELEIYGFEDSVPYPKQNSKIENGIEYNVCCSCLKFHDEVNMQCDICER